MAEGKLGKFIILSLGVAMRGFVNCVKLIPSS